MSSYSFILNPQSGYGRGRRFLPVVERFVRDERLEAEIMLTRAPGDATRLAKECSGDIVVAVGGDGTINEVANGLPSTKVIAIVPTGSGNDLTKSIDVPKKAREALDVAVHGRPIAIDVGKLWCIGDSNAVDASPGRIFVNGVGIGFDAAVAVKKSEIRRLTGTAVYVAAVLLTLRTYRSPLVEVHFTDGRTSVKRQLLMAVGNGRCAGGGFYLTPEASVADGLFDACVIEDVSVGTILRLMPAVMMGGRHRGNRHVEMFRSGSMIVTSESPLPVHADGEIIARSAREIRIECIPAALKIMVRA